MDILKKEGFSLMKVKLTALALAAAMLLSCSGVLVSCNAKENVPARTDGTEANTGTETSTAETTAAETELLTPYTYIKDLKKYDGKSFTMVAPNSGTRYLPGQMLTTEETGDVIMDAAYRRNLAVEETFGIKIKLESPASKQDSVNLYRAEILAQNGTWDLYHGFFSDSVPLALEGLLHPNTKLPYQADITDKEWYPSSVNEGLQYKGKQFIFISDMTCIALSCTCSIFMNTTLGEQFGIKGVDQLALDGKWTIDKLFEYSEGIYADLNNDGASNVGDRFGFGKYSDISNESGELPMIFQYGMGQYTTAMNKNGEPELILNTEKSVAITEKLNKLFYDTGRTTLQNGEASALSFAAGNILFYAAIIMHAANYMRDMENDYVALPMPKYDEKQEEYRVTISKASSISSYIPVSVKDVEFSSAVFDLLAYEGNKSVIPAFFENAMKLKAAKDETATKLFDLIRGGLTMDFGLAYDNSGMVTLVTKLVARNSNSFASEYAAIEEKTLAQYKDTMAMMDKLK